MNEQLIYNGIEMYESLMEAVDKAGGSASNFNLEILKTMTVLELMSHLCTNGIRFVYVESTRS